MEQGYTLVKITWKRLGKMVQGVDFREMRKVIEHIPKQRDRVLIKTLYLTAARVSELLTKVELMTWNMASPKPMTSI